MRYLILAFMLATAPAQAKVVSATPNGFEVAETVAIAADAARVYAALTQLGRWWNPAHSYSGKAERLRFTPKVGDCFCESMDDGGAIEHLRVVYVRPSQELRLHGGLGPVQLEGADGAFTWTLKPAGTGIELTQSYVVGGYIRAGAEKLAPIVDGVLLEQLTRLKRYIETGSPEKG